MPLVISENDTKWSETGDKINIIVPLQSRVDTKISILTTSLYLKVSSPPWIWECFLASAIDPFQSYARIGNDLVSFELKKKVVGVWSTLEHENKSCKAFRKERKEQAFEEERKRLEELRHSNADKKHKIYQSSVRKEMQLDESERQRIEKEKKALNEKATAEIERMRKEHQRAMQIAEKRKQMEQKVKDIPLPRKGGTITVSFTPRVFPSAARESKEAEEQEWLEKQAAAAVSLELDCQDLAPHERNPEWLKQKAQSLYAKEDHRGAINAYNLAIRMCPNMYSLYLGRSACHLHLRNLHKCIEDSSKALELLNPPVPSNAGDRMESHKIRGMAFHQLDLPVEGLMDFDAALKIYPNDEELKTYADTLRNTIQSNS